MTHFWTNDAFLSDLSFLSENVTHFYSMKNSSPFRSNAMFRYLETERKVHEKRTFPERIRSEPDPWHLWVWWTGKVPYHKKRTQKTPEWTFI